MSITTNLHGRLRNTSLPYGSGLLPVFEAVANSIHAIEDADLPTDKGAITVEILRDGQTAIDFDAGKKKPGPEPKGDITGFKITDNGVGFTDDNMESFRTLDSDYKAERGGRGVGRLLWLKAFQRVCVTSTYQEPDGTLKRREFVFRARDGVADEKQSDAGGSERATCVHLEGFGKKYRESSRKTAKVIANNLLEHCLWYFVREGGAPHITIFDGEERILLDEIYEAEMVASATTETTEIKGVAFELVHIKLSASSSRTHSIAFCAANRLVKEESIKGKIPGLYGNLHDDDGDFVYMCYVSSELLDDRVRSERTSFDIEESPLDLFAEGELSQQEIRDGIIARAAEFLGEYLEDKKRLGRERVSSFVAGRAPRYRPILARIPEDQLAIDPEISDKDLDLLLHKHLAEIEGQLLAEGHDVMNPKDGETHADYEARLQAYLKTAEDIKKSDLANYVAHRRIILDLLGKAIEQKGEGRYAREDLIHNLIMPMHSTSDEVHFETCNLWLVDERLAFHDYLASDKTLSAMPITGSDETKEPDIVSLNIYDTPVLVSDTTKLPLASIVVVELKRPMRNDAAAGEEKDPVEQALGYLERIRSGGVHTKSGRPIPKSEDIPGFCYAVCDITPTIEKRCKLLGLTPTHDHTGYFGYNPNYRAYVEVISFDRLVNGAKERNKAFFDKLGLPTT